MEKIYEIQADICKTFSNAKRMEIEMSASDLIEKIGLSKANLSEHMGVLRSKGVVPTRREGLNIFYRILNPKILQACTLMGEILLDQLRKGEDGIEF